MMPMTQKLALQHWLEVMFLRGGEEIDFFQQGIHLKVIPVELVVLE